MCRRRLTCEAGGLPGSRLLMQVFVMLLADVGESACAYAGKRHEGFLLPRHSLRQPLTLRGARGFVTRFPALDVCFHSHPLPVPIARSNVPPPPCKSKSKPYCPSACAPCRAPADIDKSSKTAENRRGRWKAVGQDGQAVYSIGRPSTTTRQATIGETLWQRRKLD